MRLSLKHESLPIALVLAAWLITAYFWPRLPDPMPIHWGVSGRPDDWAPLPWGALVGPLTATGIYVLFLVIPRLDPRRAHVESFARVYDILKTAIVAFMVLITYLSLSAAVSQSALLDTRVISAAAGLLFVVLGNYMPKLRSNFFVGVRTPWTLSNEEVWERTHRLSGKIMVLLGLAMMISGWLAPAWQVAVVIGGSLAFAAFAMGYSYWLYRRLGQTEGTPPD